MAATSVLLEVGIDAVLRAQVNALIPDEVRPQPGDTAKTLSQRLGNSTFLDDIHFLKKGCGVRAWRREEWI